MRYTKEEIETLMQGKKDGLSFKEIADKLGRDVKSVQNKYYASRKKNAGIKSSKRWTPEEDRCLADQLRRNSECFENGFKEASRLIGRSISACKSRWYQHVSIQEDISPVIVVGTEKYQCINRRYPSRPSLTKKRTANWFKKVCCFFGFTKKQ